MPLFPLPRTVLMPGQLLPLHVFEPRYRALVDHCLEGPGVMGIATLRPGFEQDYYGAPAIYGEIGVGRLVQHQGFPDGRCNIVLESVGSMLLVDEIEADSPFRQARGRLLIDDHRGSEEPLRRLRVLVLQLGAVSAEAAEEAQRLVDLESVDLVDSLARKLLEDPDDRRAFLGTTSVAARVAVVQGELSRFLGARSPAAEA